MIGLSIVAVGLIGFITAHMVGGLVTILGLIMANPIHAIILSIATLSLLFLPSKK